MQTDWGALAAATRFRQLAETSFQLRLYRLGLLRIAVFRQVNFVRPIFARAGADRNAMPCFGGPLAITRISISCPSSAVRARLAKR
jgi:hypothetical protein